MSFIQVMNGVVEFTCVLTDILPAASVHFCKKVLMSPTIIVNLSLSPSGSIRFCLTYFLVLLFGACTGLLCLLDGLTLFRYVMNLCLWQFFVLKSTLPDINTPIPVFF